MKRQAKQDDLRHQEVDESWELVGADTLTAMAASARTPKHMHSQRNDNLRLIPTWELTTHWLGITSTHLRRILKTHPNLPQGNTSVEAGMRWFTAKEARTLQIFLDKNGRPKTPLIKSKPKNAIAHIISICNSSPNSGKSAIATHLAMQYARDGYKTLLIDLDQSATSTHAIFGRNVEDYVSIEGLLLRSFQEGLQSSNQARIERGEPPLILPDEEIIRLRENTHPRVLNSFWPGLSLIPSTNTLNSLNRRMLNWSKIDFRWKYWQSITKVFLETRIPEEFDIILFDHSAYESLISSAALMASDSILIPAINKNIESGSLTDFLETLAELVNDIEKSENATAQALGKGTQKFGWDDVRIIPSHVDPEANADQTPKFPSALLPIVLRKENRYIDSLGHQAVFNTPFFLLDQRKIGRDAYISGRAVLDELYKAVEQLSLASTKWRGKPVMEA